jgi:diguanylate cyclase (GGDEF)-like protein
VYQLIYETGASRDAGTLWIATDTGVWKQDVSGKVPAQAVRVPVPNVTTQAIARSGNDLWVGTTEDLYRYDVKTGSVEQISIAPQSGGNAAIFSLALDKQQRLWVATNGGGLMVLTGRDAQGHPIFQTVKGLPDGNVDGVEAGQDGRMWTSTDDGVAVVDPKTMEATPLSEPDGVEILSSWPNALGAAADGTILFSGQGGLTVLQPKAVKPWTFVPPVVVTTVRVAGKVVPFDNGAPSTIEVTHEANSLEVEFASLDFTAPELNQYEYRLIGFDRDWVKTDANRHSANYTNLPPGRYRLELRGSNRVGAWGPTREVEVHQLPAWWQTWWARLLFAVLFLLGLLAAFYALTAYQRRRQRLLEAAVTERTRALQQSQKELEASHRRMEQIAYSDSLTGIANRRLFNDRFRRLIAKKQGTSGGFVLMLIDLDKFKQINDTFGHDAGDAWLRAVAARMRPSVHEEECFARLGGDEFGILMAEAMTDDAIALECETIAGLFIEPVSVEGVDIRTTLSIGVAVYGEDATTLEALYKAADIALYSIKREGGNGWRRYTSDLPGGRGQGESPSSGKPRATDPV